MKNSAKRAVTIDPTERLLRKIIMGIASSRPAATVSNQPPILPAGQLRSDALPHQAAGSAAAAESVVRERPLPGQRYFKACDNRCVETTALGLLAATLLGGGGALLGLSILGCKGKGILSAGHAVNVSAYDCTDAQVGACIGGTASICAGVMTAGTAACRPNRAPRAPSEPPVPQTMTRSDSAGEIHQTPATIEMSRGLI